MSEEKQPKRGKQNGYSSAISRAKRDARRVAAEKREDRYDRLGLTDKIKLVKSRRGESKRELARLEARMATQKTAPAKTPPATEGQKAVKAVSRAKSAAKAAKR